MNGALQFWNVFNEHNKKLQSYYKEQQGGATTATTGKTEDDGADDVQPDEEEENADEPLAGGISSFEMKFEETKIHSGPVFKTTTSNGVLLSSAKSSNLESESFFIDNV